MVIRKKTIFLSTLFSLFFSLNRFIFFIRGILGYSFFKFPSLFFFKQSLKELSFLFLNYFFYKSTYKHLLYLLSCLFFFNYVKLRIKGLGYRIRKISNSFLCFFLGHTHFFYFHAPKSLLIRARKRRFVMLSNKLFVLKNILAQFFLLKRLIIYRIRGLVQPRQILELKIGKKNL